MSDLYPLVELAAVLVRDDAGRYLVDFNEAWGSFTFPTTKVRDLPGLTPEAATTREAPIAAACRAIAEVTGRPIDPKSVKPIAAEVPPYNQSGRDGQWKRYTVRLFTLSVVGPVQPLSGHSAVWLTRQELESLEPISPTVRSILKVV